MANDVGERWTVWAETGTARPEVRFAERIRQMRLAAGFSQRELAEQVNRLFGLSWTQSIVAKLEANERPIRLDEAAALATVLPANANIPPIEWARQLHDLVQVETRPSDPAELDSWELELRERLAVLDRQLVEVQARLSSLAYERERLRASLMVVETRRSPNADGERQEEA